MKSMILNKGFIYIQAPLIYFLMFQYRNQHEKNKLIQKALKQKKDEVMVEQEMSEETKQNIRSSLDKQFDNLQFELVSCKIRAAGKDLKHIQKIEPMNAAKGIFGMHLLKQDATQVILTEGEFDAMAAYQMTNIPVISLPYGQINLRMTYIDQSKCLLKKNIIQFTDFIQLTKNRILNFEQSKDTQSQTFTTFNNTTKGLRTGQFSILTGPTGSGKTTFLSQLSLDFCKEGITTLWDSFEIKTDRLAEHQLLQAYKTDIIKQKDLIDIAIHKFENEIPINNNNYNNNPKISKKDNSNYLNDEDDDQMAQLDQMALLYENQEISELIINEKPVRFVINDIKKIDKLPINEFLEIQDYEQTQYHQKNIFIQNAQLGNVKNVSHDYIQIWKFDQDSNYGLEPKIGQYDYNKDNNNLTEFYSNEFTLYNNDLFNKLDDHKINKELDQISQCDEFQHIEDQIEITNQNKNQISKTKKASFIYIGSIKPLKQQLDL